MESFFWGPASHFGLFLNNDFVFFDVPFEPRMGWKLPWTIRWWRKSWDAILPRRCELPAAGGGWNFSTEGLLRCLTWHEYVFVGFSGSFELEDYSKYGQFTIVGDYSWFILMTIGWKTSHDLGIHRSIWFWTLIGTYWNAWLFTKLDSRESAIGEVTYEWREWTWIPSMCSSIWRIHNLTGAFYVGEFSGMIHWLTIFRIIPATPSNPSSNPT